MERKLWVRAGTRRILGATTVAAALWAGGCSPPDDGSGRVATSQIRLEARAASGQVLEAVAVDSTWWLVGEDQESVGMRSFLLPDTTEFISGILHAMVRNGELVRVRPGPWEEGGSPAIRWDIRLNLPGSASFRSSVRGQFQDDGEGGWVAEGPFVRDFRWIINTGDQPDTVRIDLSGTFLERRTSEGMGEFRVVADGTLSRASTGESVDLTMSMGTSDGTASSGSILRRQEALRGADLLEGGGG